MIFNTIYQKQRIWRCVEQTQTPAEVQQKWQNHPKFQPDIKETISDKLNAPTTLAARKICCQFNSGLSPLIAVYYLTESGSERIFGAARQHHCKASYVWMSTRLKIRLIQGLCAFQVGWVIWIAFLRAKGAPWGSEGQSKCDWRWWRRSPQGCDGVGCRMTGWWSMVWGSSVPLSSLPGASGITEEINRLTYSPCPGPYLIYT